VEVAHRPSESYPGLAIPEFQRIFIEAKALTQRNQSAPTTYLLPCCKLPAL
jgi:hypothetical protein